MWWWKKVLYVVKVKKILESNCRFFVGRSGKIGIYIVMVVLVLNNNSF